MSDARELADLRRLAEAATPGPWETEPDRTSDWFAIYGRESRLTHAYATGRRPCRHDPEPVLAIADAAYIAAADPQTVLTLLAAAERGERAIGLLQDIWDVRNSVDLEEFYDRMADLLAEVDRAE